ncbi:MAG: nuclear transport factor 2 family protein [Acidobacteriota bacterium]
MNEETRVNEIDRESLVKDYLDAMEKRDLERCMGFYTNDATLYFGPRTLGFGSFSGYEEIKQWHQERFEAGMVVTEVEEIEVESDTVTVHAKATSPRLKAVNIDHFRGYAKFIFEGHGKFKEVRLGLRTGWRFHL